MGAAKNSRGPAAVLLALAFLAAPVMGVRHTHPLQGVPRKPIDLFVGVQVSWGSPRLCVQPTKHAAQSWARKR